MEVEEKRTLSPSSASYLSCLSGVEGDYFNYFEVEEFYLCDFIFNF